MSMFRWESQLEQQTAAVIGRIDEMDDRRRQADAELKQLLTHQGHTQSKQLQMVLQLLQESLPGKVVDGATSTSASRSKVREFTLDEVQVQFDDDSLLGEGTGGKVYWGRLQSVLPAGKDEVAFNRLAVAASTRPSPSSSLRSRGRGRGRGPAATTATAVPASTAASDEPDGADSMVQMLRREAKVAWRLNGNPQCVKLHGTCPQPPALIYEYCNWGTLSDLLYQQVWDDDQGSMRWVSHLQLTLEDKVSCVA